MSRKSLLVSMEITTAGRLHSCRYNKRHPIKKGIKRLTIKTDGEPHHYCLACARVFMEASTTRLAEIRAEIEGLMSGGSAQSINPT
jgi:hypothetical protein